LFVIKFQRPSKNAKDILSQNKLKTNTRLSEEFQRLIVIETEETVM